MKQNLLVLMMGMASVMGCSMEASESENGDVVAEEDTATQQEAVRLCNGDLDHTYLAGFGRAPTVAEQQYWCPRNVDWSSMQQYMKDWLVSSSGKTDQSETITRVYRQIYGRNPSSNERNYWISQAAAHGGYTYSEMAPWLADYGRTYGRLTGSTQYWCFYIQGVKLCNSATYSVTPG